MKITIKGHDAFGQTLSRADGKFDMAVNGGGLLTINYEKAGYLPVQRQVRPQWNDYAFADDIVMIQLDPEVTTVQLGNGQPMQVAQGSPQTDADGTRQATILFPSNTSATMTLPDGSIQALTTLNVRATEYTVGDNGFEAMPGELPPTSAYTYAVELSVDEAMAAGSNRVDFNQPVPLYVDNFLNFPTGEIVPAGYYDYDDAVWKAGDNGRVIEILNIEDGLAILDLEGEGQAATIEELQALGIDEEEQQKLATLYAAGKTLWRTPISHFTPWDCNWPYGPPMDAERPNVPVPETNNRNQPENSNEQNECPGCVISPQRQTLGESLPIAGTPFELVYRSDRTAGYKNNSATVILSGPTVSASLSQITLSIEVAGQKITQKFNGSPNQKFYFEWNGLDGFGREVWGDHEVNFTVNYLYPCVYYSARSDFLKAWARVGNTGSAIRSGRYGCKSVVLSRSHTVSLTSPITANKSTVGDWALSVHHAYDRTNNKLLLGSGQVQSSRGGIIETVAGSGGSGFSGDGGLATEASLGSPRGLAFDPLGNLYIADANNNRIRRVGLDGIIQTIAGSGDMGFSGDGGPAMEALLNRPSGLAFDSSGNLYIADSGNRRIRRVSLDGTIQTIAGTGDRGFSGDGGPAIEALFYSLPGIAFDAVGNLFVADNHYGNGTGRIRRIDVDGIIETVAGNGMQVGGVPNGIPATQARLSYPEWISIDNQGNLYIGNMLRIYRVTTNGIIEAVAGNGNEGFSGDGGPATEA